LQLEPRFGNRAALMAFVKLRCAVTDPDKVRTEVVGTARVVQYPAAVQEAPPVQDGEYGYSWDGLDSKGNWQNIKDGTHQVSRSAPARTRKPLELTLEDETWEMWQGVAWIAAIKVRITN